MKIKSLSSFLLSVITVVFALALVSAAQVQFTQLVTSVNYTATISAPTVVTVTPILNDLGTNIAPSTTINGQTVTFTSSPDYASLTIGKIYSGTAKISNAASSNETVSIEFSKTFCLAGTQNATDLKLSVDISNNGEGEDTTWHLLDSIEVDTTFDNNKAEDLGDLEDVILELALIDSDGNDVSDDLIWKSTNEEKAKLKDVDGGEDADHLFEFEVSNKLAEGDYKLMLKVYPDGEESTTCLDKSTDLGTTYYQTIKVERESDDEKQIVLKDITVEPSTSPCGNDVTITAKAYNVGDSGKQDAVKFFLFNNDLGINMNKVITSFDEDETKTIEFTVKIPETAKEGIYDFTLYSKYDYDKEDDKDNSDDKVDYDDDSFGEESESSKVSLSLEGSCTGSPVSGITGAVIDKTEFVSLNDDVNPIIGEQIVYRVPIKNTGDSTTTYTVSVSGVSSWAEVKVDPETISIPAGESDTVDIYLDIDKSAEVGEKEFTIKATFGSQTVEQKVLVDLQKGGLFAGSSLADNIKSNAFIYVIILIDIILIIAIIIAVTRMVKKKQ